MQLLGCDAGLGFKPLHVVFYIVLPQAIRNVLAPLASNSLELVKATPIAALVALPELLRSARVAQEQTYNPTGPVQAFAAPKLEADIRHLMQDCPQSITDARGIANG